MIKTVATKVLRINNVMKPTFIFLDFLKWRGFVAESSRCLAIVTSDFGSLRELDDIAALVYHSHIFALSSKTKKIDLFQRKRHLLHLQNPNYEVFAKLS